MKWLEIIEIRSTKPIQARLESHLKNLIADLKDLIDGQSIKIYTLATLDTDISIHLIHKSRNIEKGGSTLGLHLASALKEFGLVSHTVWLEMENKK